MKYFLVQYGAGRFEDENGLNFDLEFFPDAFKNKGVKWIEFMQFLAMKKELAAMFCAKNKIFFICQSCIGP